MKLRRCFVPLQLLFLLAAALIISSAGSAMSQDAITLTSGQVVPVHIVGVTPSGLQVQVGESTATVPLANLTAVTMTPPPEYAAAQAALESGDARRALALDSVLLATYRGLPADWAREAMLMKGDIYLALGQPSQAQDAFKDFQAAYPTSGSDQLNAGLAAVAISTGDYATASTKIAPIINQALTQRIPSKSASALYCRAFFVSGKIKEHASDFPGALEDYLRAAVVFPDDPIAAAGAQTAADTLRKERGVTVQ